MFAQAMLREIALITIADLTADITGGIASYSLESDGDIMATVGAAPTDQGDWIVPRSSAGSNYEVECVVNAGTLSSGPFGAGTWSGLGTTRTWTRGGPGDQTCTITLSIRRVGTTTVLDTAQIVLTRDV